MVMTERACFVKTIQAKKTGDVPPGYSQSGNVFMITRAVYDWERISSLNPND